MTLEIGTVLALERQLTEMKQNLWHAQEPNGFALRLQRFDFARHKAQFSAVNWLCEFPI